MENPWENLRESAPFLLPSDERIMKSFNDSADDVHKTRFELLPEPYLGRVEADIVLLNLNPGFGENDAPFYEQPYVRNLWKKNIRHEYSDYPFYLLDPTLYERDPTLAERDGPGWWKRKLKQVIELAGLAAAANNICCIEYFPYHSRKFHGIGQVLESQRYSFELVGQAIARKAVMIMMRGERFWFPSVPDLEQYDRLFRLNSSQNVSITRNNCPVGFPEIERIFRRLI